MQQDNNLPELLDTTPSLNEGHLQAEPSKQAQQEAAPALKEDLPALGAGLSQRANKKGILFLVILAAVGLAFATIAVKRVLSSEPKKEAPPAEEVVNTTPQPDLLSGDASALELLDRQKHAASQAQAAAAFSSQENALPVLPTGTNTGDFSTSTSTAPISVESSPSSQGGSNSVAYSGSSNVATPVDSNGLDASLFSAPPKSTGDLLMERRVAGGSVLSNNEMVARANNIEGSPESSPNDSSAKGEAATLVSKLKNPDYTMVKGSYIRCVLETKVVSDLSGYTSCIVADPVYSFSGKKLLIEKGSRISGQYLNGNLDSGRVAVIWNRVLTPSGRDIKLNSPGIDRMGGAGHPGYVDERWVSRLGGAIMLSLVSDVFNYAAIKTLPTQKKVTVDATTGVSTTIEEPFNSKTVDSISKIPDQILARTLNRPATVYINQGELISIYTAKDIDFSSVMD